MPLSEVARLRDELHLYSSFESGVSSADEQTPTKAIQEHGNEEYRLLGEIRRLDDEHNQLSSQLVLLRRAVTDTAKR